MPSYHQSESSARRQERQHRYPSYGGESVDATQIRRESVASDESRSVKHLANQLIQTASFDYNDNRNSYHSEKENEACVQHEYEKSSRSRNSRERDSEHDERAFLETNYTLAMSQANRRDYGPARSKQNKATQVEKRSSRSEDAVQKRSSAKSTDRRTEQMSVISSASTSQPVPVKAKKRSVSKKDPSEETIAIFGAYGVTGQYFLQRAMEAGYNIQAMILPGMEMEDVACSKSLRLITGSLIEVEKIREVVENATYVVCLLNDCDDENFNPPIGNADEDEGYQFNNLNFMHNLVPILEHSKTCRVLLYEVSGNLVWKFICSSFSILIDLNNDFHRFRIHFLLNTGVIFVQG